MGLFANIAISLVTAAIGAFGIYNYVPLSVFESLPQASQRNFGATITTIAGTDTLSSSRSVINTNFSNLNTNKFELSDWYATTSAAQLTSLANLATVGTITSGVWSGTAILASKGGTGSTTLSQYQVLLGNATGNVTTPTGWGTSGQSLVSNGVGAAPSWQSVGTDLTQNYTWTGTHTFTATTSIAASDVIAAPVKFNAIAYAFPPTQGASSTILSTNGSGRLSWIDKFVHVLYNNPNAAATASGTTASTTVLTVVLPANTITPTLGKLNINATFTQSTPNNAACSYQIDYGIGSATSTSVMSTTGAAGSISRITGEIMATSTTNYNQTSVRHNQNNVISGGAAFGVTNTAAQTYIAFIVRPSDNADTCIFLGGTVTLTR